MPTESPGLRRTLTLWPLVLFGIAYVTPFVVLTTFGIFAEASNGTLAATYALATGAMIFTALSYGKLAGLYPQAGSAYTYARRAIGAKVGFMTGWALLLDYLFLPMVVWLFGTAYLTDQFPMVPGWVFLLAFIVLTTTLNVIGISVATRVNLALISFQVLVLVFFVVFSLDAVVETSGVAGLASAEPFWNPASTLAAVSGGAALAAYSFIGFDAVSTFAEETVEPRRTVPRAIVLTAAGAGGIFILVAYAVQLVHPGGVFANADSAALDIAKEIGGDLFGAVFLATVIVAQFTAGIPIQAAGARLMYAMGRDGVLPKKLFAAIHPRFRTPFLNILITGAIGLLALVLTVTTSTSFINFGAFMGFSVVNIAVIAQYFRDRRTVRRNPVTWIILPLFGLFFVGWLIISLDGKALVLGAVWAAVGLGWLAYLTRGFRLAPPELDLDDTSHAGSTQPRGTVR
ncbi:MULTISPECIES: APC family permease [Amycolatopsis]|uniref:APC family permease n=1 Tax=Amycolatopsis thermalba TaxID=944492 RepID=A0ABY4P361_9PSEU|nr:MULTISPECIES: APC family permease [Amycolatopsis]OXM73720.1 Putrescine importer PuuP [Amycolatopsis sp. KNN50.9b]UQS26668.1 APC family permease [Amycolatopsis thermalba]